jgi:ribosomal protein S27AE
MTKEERYAKAAEYFGKGDGHVTLTECPVCGYIDWNSTNLNEPIGFKVIPLESQCPRCVGVYNRAPELVNWVLGVVTKAQDDMSKI